MGPKATPRAAARRRRLALSLVVGILLAAIGIGAALAQADLGGKIRTGNDVRVGADEVITTDLYAFGGSVTIDGSVEGDIVASGGNVTVRGPVGGDVLLAGGTVRVDGQVTGDVRLAGGTITIAGQVGEDALVAGGQVELAPTGSVGEDMVASAGQLTVAGTITGSITGGAGIYNRSGTVGGTDEIVVTRPPEEPAQDRTVDAVADAIRHFLAVALVGVLALWLAPRLMLAAAETLRSAPLPAAGWGILVIVLLLALLVVIPIVAIILAVILGLLGFGELVALVVLGTVFLFLGVLLLLALGVGFLADVVVGLGLARLFWDRTDTTDAGTVGAADLVRRDVDGTRWVLPMLVGAAIVVILVSLPIVGGWIHTIVAVLGIGALFAAWWRGRRARGRREPPAEPMMATPGGGA